mmetsp:Transcript_54866/g.174361  ORF Transcript_54866/g.174361 Transcript_54866/m.174361 type:complete len:176 (+) Transcript_54866:75-602(+)
MVAALGKLGAVLDVVVVGQAVGSWVLRKLRRGKNAKAFKAQDRLTAGKVEVAQWPMSTVYLVNDSNFPWLMLVPRQNDLREFVDLCEDDSVQVFKEVNKATKVLQEISQSLFGFQPFKMNVGQLGCVVQQLHVHVLARNEGDVCWPGPVWGQAPAKPYEATKLYQVVNELKEALA